MSSYFFRRFWPISSHFRVSPLSRPVSPFSRLGTELMRVGQVTAWIFYRAGLHQECAVQLRIPDAVAVPRVAEPFHGLGSFSKQWHDHGARVDVNLWSQFPPSTGHVCLVTSASEWTLMRRWSLMCSVACCRLQVCW